MEDKYYPIEESYFVSHIEPYILKHHKRSGRPTIISHYQFFSGVLYVLRTGIAWRDLPDFYGNWNTLYMRFKRWSENGLFWGLLYELQQRKKIKIDCILVDRTKVNFKNPVGGALKKEGSVSRAII